MPSSQLRGARTGFALGLAVAYDGTGKSNMEALIMRRLVLVSIVLLLGCDQGGSSAADEVDGGSAGESERSGIVEIFRVPNEASERAREPSDAIGATERDVQDRDDASRAASEPGPQAPSVSPACQAACDSLTGDSASAQCVENGLAEWGYSWKDRCAGALSAPGSCADCIAAAGVTSPDCTEALEICQESGAPPLEEPGHPSDPQVCFQQTCPMEIEDCYGSEECYSLLVCLQGCSTENCQWTCVENASYLAQDLFFVMNDCAVCSGCYGDIAPDGYCH